MSPVASRPRSSSAAARAYNAERSSTHSAAAAAAAASAAASAAAAYAFAVGGDGDGGSGGSGGADWSEHAPDNPEDINELKALRKLFGREKKIQQEQILLNIDSRKSELDVSLQTILRDLELSEQAVSAAQAVVKLAEEQLQNEIDRFSLGQGTSFQVSQFQQQQSQAKAQEILARVRYEKAYLRLLTLTGQIYEEFNLNRTKS